jgi:hypothetical protein
VKRISIPASPSDRNPKKRFVQEIIVVLPDDLSDGYDVAGKEYPDNLPNEWTDPDDKRTKRIDWIGSFGLMQKGAPATSLPAGKKYTILLPASTRKYVYFDGHSVRKLATRAAAREAGRLEAEFADADPPVGMT